MEHVPALLGIGTAIAVGAASPGPSFVMVARTAVSMSRLDALCAALGMGVGGLFFAVISLLGLHGLLLAVPSLYWVLKVAGGLYLAYLGVRIWRSASNPLLEPLVDSNRSARSALRSVAMGLTTQMSNPKAAIVYSSVFAAFLPASPSMAFNLSVAAMVFSIEIGWYVFVALTLSATGPRSVYLRYKSWIDRLAGGVMIALGLKLVSAANRS